MSNITEVSQKNSERYLALSRLDYPAHGARVGLWKLGAKIAEIERPNYIYIAGGLISHEGVRDRINSATEAAIEEQKAKKEFMKTLPVSERVPVPTQVEVRATVRERVLDEIAQELADALPVFPGNGKRGKPLKIYITTSRANNYDGSHGPDVADRLQKIRRDVIFWDRESSRFKAKYIFSYLKNKMQVPKVLWNLNPVKGSWRSEYYATSAQRLVFDKVKQTSQGLPDIWTIGTGASAINKPAGGESSRQMITIPGLHRLQEINTSENQIGVVVVELSDGKSPSSVRTYNFKDLVAQEREFIRAPKGLEDDDSLTKYERDQRARQRAIFEEVVNNIPTIGMLEDALPWRRQTIERDIEHYNAQGFKPAIVQDESSGKYNISYEWLQHKLRYPAPDFSKLVEDSSVSYSCIHAGYRTSQYKWFLERTVSTILERGIQSLVGCGDFIAGLKHNLDFRGELLPGANNYNIQEEFAARLNAAVMVRVFRERFDVCLARKRKTPDEKTMREMVNSALIHFYYTAGNHDAWVEDDGYTTLSKFNDTLKAYVVEGIQDHLADRGFGLKGLRGIVENHLHYGGEHAFPSGITMSIRHPRQGRMKTFSGKAQQTLAATEGQVVYIGNFHVGIAVHEWHPELRQRVAMQEGTIATGTDFENHMNKLVDNEFGVLRVWSDPDTNYIFKTEVIWESPQPEEVINYKDRITVKEIMKNLDI
ncbi:MAG: hypothetical protein WDZ40_02635 [Candidatus Spechtbacterales bacterium]